MSTGFSGSESAGVRIGVARLAGRLAIATKMGADHVVNSTKVVRSRRSYA
jgi:hypothetical protein